MTTQDIAGFILAHYRPSKDWPLNDLFNWVNWAIENGFMFMVGNSEDDIRGLAIVRPVMHPHEVADTLEHDPEGDCYFVDLAIALSPRRDVLQTLCFIGLNRFGMRDRIAFQDQRSRAVIVVDAHEHRRRLLRTMKEVHHG